MSGGVLVVVDRLGRPTRRFPLSHGLATLGSGLDNDIRITLPTVAPHHATVFIHDAQALIRATGGVTMVNGGAVSVAPLQHGDVITVGERALRWEYSSPRAAPNHLPNVVRGPLSAERRGRRAHERRSAPAGGAASTRDRAVQLALETAHRASIAGSAGGKQVAIVQPQRRGTNDAETSAARASPLTTRRCNYEPRSSADNTERKSTRTSPNSFLQNTTKATLWIESRKTSPRRKVQTALQAAPARRSLPNKKTTPLRMTVLKKAQSAHKARVIKIEAPLKIDHTKQAAIMLMTGHTPKSKLSITPKNKSSSKKSPSYLVKRPSPVRSTPRGRSARASRGARAAGSVAGAPAPARGSAGLHSPRRSPNKRASDRTVSILEISDSSQNSSRLTGRSPPSGDSRLKSPVLPSPKKSAMKDCSKKSLRKTESIKFDLSNLDNPRRSDTMRYDSDDSEDITLRYSESSVQSQSPSPRRSIHSRGGRMLERAGAVLTPTSASISPSRSPSAASPRARRSLRADALLQRALDNSSDRTRSDLSTMLSPDRTRSDLSATIDPDRTRSDLSATTIAPSRTKSRLSATTDASDRTGSDQSATTVAPDRTKSRVSANATVAAAFRTRTLSPRHNLESYSVVDLVSFDSEDATKSVYGSADSTSASAFGTPAASGRRTRSTIEPVLLGSSTPYAGRARPARAKSSSDTEYTRSVVSTRRSKSLTTPENGRPAVVTRAPRASRSRSRIHDDLSLLDLTEPDDSSPRTSRRSRTNASEIIDVSNVDLGGETDVGATTPENRRSPEAEGTPQLSIRSFLGSSRGSVGSQGSARRERDGAATARRSRLQLSRESAGSEDDGLVTPTSAAKPSPESVRNKHSTAKKPRSKRSIIDDLDRSDIVKQLFDSPVKRKLTQSMSEFSRKRLFEEDEDERPARKTRRTLAAAPSAPSLVRPRAGSRRDGRGRKSPRDDLTDVRGVKAAFGKPPRDDLTDVRGVRRMFQKHTRPADDLRNVSGVKRILKASPKNDLTDVRGVRKMFKKNDHKARYRDVSGVEELFRSADSSEVLFDALVGRPPIKAVYSRTFTGREARRPRTRRRSLRTSVDVNNVEEWLEEQLQRHLPAASSRVSTEMRKLATDTVEGAEPIVARRTRNSSVGAAPGGAPAPPAPPSPRRARRPVQRAVHSTPLKGRLQLTMNASELGRVSPIAVDRPSARAQVEHDSFVSMSTQSTDEGKAVGPGSRTPRKQRSLKTVKIANPEEKSPVQSTSRATRNRKVMASVSPKGTARTRSRAAKAALVVAKSPPKLKPRGKKASEKSQTEQAPTRVVTEKKPESPKASPKNKRKTRANASKNEPKTKPEQNKAEAPPEEQPPQLKRTRRNALKSNVEETHQNSVVKTRRAKASTAKSDVKKDQPNSRTKTESKQVQSQNTEEKKNNTRDKKVRFDTELLTEPRPRRGKKAIVEEIEPKTRRNTVQSSPRVESQPATRTRKAKVAESAITETTDTRRGKRKAANVEDSSNAIPRPKRGKTTKTPEKKATTKQKGSVSKDDKVEIGMQVTAKPVRATRSKAIQEAVKIETKTTRARGRKAEPKEIVAKPIRRNKKT